MNPSYKISVLLVIFLPLQVMFFFLFSPFLQKEKNIIPELLKTIFFGLFNAWEILVYIKECRLQHPTLKFKTRDTSFSQPRFDPPSCWKTVHWECPGWPVHRAQEQYAQLNLTDAKMCKNVQCSVSQQSSRSRPNWLWLKPAMTHLLVAYSSHFTTVPILVKAYRLVTVLEQTVRLCRPVVNLSAHLPWIKCVCQLVGSSSTVMSPFRVAAVFFILCQILQIMNSWMHSSIL